MDLDEIDPARWALLDAATDQYITEQDAAFDACARLLVHNVPEQCHRPVDIYKVALGLCPIIRGLSVKLCYAVFGLGSSHLLHSSTLTRLCLCKYNHPSNAS